MHVLLTNDDGPLNDISCPYIKYLVDEINETTDWDLSIVVPNQQRSWIGKAHFAGKTLYTTYIYTKNSTKVKNDSINAFEGPFYSVNEKLQKDPEYQEWCLVDSTPAACADLGIHHLYGERKEKPIDLVLSGPNLGKNSSNLYILASGTVGAAMEAVTHGIKSIALSYAFINSDHDYDILKEAAKISVKLIKKLYNQLQEQKDVDLYSINVPLIESLKLGRTSIHYTPILENYWASIYSKASEVNELGQEQFHWNPDFKKVYKDGLTDYRHTDSRVLLDEGISVTPLKASFHIAEPRSGEIILDDEDEESSGLVNKLSLNESLVFLITVGSDSYIYAPLVEAFKKKFFNVSITDDVSILSEIRSKPNLKVFHYGEYEDLDIDLISECPKQYFIPSYIYRKALIRKHYLANTIHHFVAKNPSLVLANAAPTSYQLEVDYAEFLDDALDECYELREEIETSEKTWILKPSMSDKGQGIRIFKTIDQLQEIFNSFEGDSDDEQEEDDDKHGIIISQLRHFIVQEYKNKPLLLSTYSNRKFHLRTYVVCCGNLKVYVYKNILTLFSDVLYETPEEDESGEIPMAGHLTNTCLQEDATPLVVPFWDLDDKEFSTTKKELVFDQVAKITGELFNAATSVNKMNFQPLDNAAEVFGIDYLVNDDYSVTLLEVNSYPDFKQTGDELKNIIYELFDNLVTDAINPLVTGDASVSLTTSLVPVLEQVSRY